MDGKQSLSERGESRIGGDRRKESNGVDRKERTNKRGRATWMRVKRGISNHLYYSWLHPCLQVDSQGKHHDDYIRLTTRC